MKKSTIFAVQKVLAVALIVACVLCGCTTSPETDGTTTTTTTTAVPTTTRTTGTPTTFMASAETKLELSSPTGDRPDAEVFERLASLCKANGNFVSVYYKDLQRGYTLTFRADEIYQAASVIKAPYVKHLLESGVDLTKKLSLSSKQGGSTYIDQFPAGTEFTVEELMEYAIRYSDNTAYYMLNKEFGFDSFNAYAEKLGIEANAKRGLTLQFSKPRFGYLSARDVGLYFEDIYRYIETGTPEAKKLFSWLITTTEQSQFPAAFNAKTYSMLDAESESAAGAVSNLKDEGQLNNAYAARFEGYTIGHKYGVQDYGEAWNRAYHDGAIVWCEHPYVLVITSNLPTQTAESNKVFHDIAALVDQLQYEFYQN